MVRILRPRTGEPRTRQVSVRVTEQEYERLTNLALQSNTSIAALAWSPGIKEALDLSGRVQAKVGRPE